MSLKIVGGLFRGRILKSPKGDSTRPTTGMLREAVFNICRDWVHDGKFLDLFAGSGAMGFEAISRGASFVTFVEKDRLAAECIRANIELLQVQQQAQVLSIDVKTALPKLMSPYDLIYIDPPYDMDVSLVFHLIHKHRLLSAGGVILFEERFDAEKTPAFEGFELLESRRYGIAYLHQFKGL